MKSILVLLLVSAALAAPAEIFFLPPAEEAAVSFRGSTPARDEMHRLEVRKLAFRSDSSEAVPTVSSCVVYYAGKEYGPAILKVLPDCVSPVVRKVGADIVEVFFVAGANTHIRQRWKLLGHSAEMVEEAAIEWHENPIHKK